MPLHPTACVRRKAKAIVASFASPVNSRYNAIMHIWDYDEKKLRKSKWGRFHILEHMINYGPGRHKISLKAVKNNWKKLDIDPLRRRLFQLLIWGK